MKLSKNLTLAEAVRSETAKRVGIDNKPTKEHIENLKVTAENALKNSSNTSLHMTGQAMDIDMDHTSISNKQIFDFIKDELDFDTLLWEHGEDSPSWVHVSYREGRNRKQVLEAYKHEATGLLQYKQYEQRKAKQKEVQGDKTRSISTGKVRSVSDSSRKHTK